MAARRLQRLVPLGAEPSRPALSPAPLVGTGGLRSVPAAASSGPDWDALHAAFRADGVVAVRQAFDMEWIERLRSMVPQALAGENGDLERYSRPADAAFVGEMDCSRKYPVCQHFVFESPAAEVAARCIGAASLNFFYDFLFVKEPGTPARTPWHQDLPYWHVEGADIVSIWLPLDDVPRESSLEFLRGSHLSGEEFAPVKIGDGSRYQGSAGMPAVPIAAETPEQVLSWELKLGDCLVFDSRVVHAAPPVAAGAPRRRAFATRWCGEDARYCVSTKCEETRRSGYPNFACGLEEGDALTCRAFPIVWPPERRLAESGYRGLEAEQQADLLTLQPDRDYAQVRRAQAVAYSTGVAAG